MNQAGTRVDEYFDTCMVLLRTSECSETDEKCQRAMHDAHINYAITDYVKKV